jgi:hypothetical protein
MSTDETRIINLASDTSLHTADVGHDACGFTQSPLHLIGHCCHWHRHERHFGIGINSAVLNYSALQSFVDSVGVVVIARHNPAAIT